MHRIVVHCPEEWQYKDIVKKVGWYDNDDKRDIWGQRKRDFSVTIEHDKIDGWGGFVFHRDNSPYCNYTFYTYKEFINKFFPNRKTKGNIMGVIKDVFKSETRKALEHYDIVNGDGGLTEKGRQEFVDFMWATEESSKKFTDTIVREYKKEKK